MLDKLKHIDEAKRQQDLELGPNECQKEFAGMLGKIGRWDLFMTGSFKPNKYEEIAQRKNDEYYQNEKMKWCGGRRILKRRTRNGGGIYGSPSIAPGWSLQAALRQGREFMIRNFKRSRWALFAESSKYRNCAHVHALIANAPEFNPEAISARWQKKFGRFDIEAIKDDLGIAHYLCKGYVAKNYGKSDDLEFEFSRNARHATSDSTPPWYYHLRCSAFKHGRGGDRDVWARIGQDLKTRALAEVGAGA